MERMEHHSSEEKDASASGPGKSSGTSSHTDVMKAMYSDWTNPEVAKEGHLDQSVDDHSPTTGSQPSSSPPPSDSHGAGITLGQFVFVLVRLQTDFSMMQVNVLPGWIQNGSGLGGTADDVGPLPRRLDFILLGSCFLQPSCRTS